ncbi:hypothetical protein LTR35_009444 [Friedmanniomyces endolithicus]|uniref:Uncharacterized protein n=1 Tax=Friedmanniomyces endolithicus TaxID=329885 RepID=A0AAN6FGE1_9PEZI|nr:hypothetical protein LTR35_009444 [Friedmanniomyces endolithicus]KAK0290786.1 hypothetical protein LTS00_008562 [Friedmanniomyces endolithicus]KAK0317023.1 hypothetical protein LTR82_011891 [Friedmanniomyces endolithicus]KAK0997877.1 hypothetical protein LTR54_009674 [Friedmanniomyces endolithicus]
MATIAPPKAQANYLNIPPPPLPEWYLPKKTPGRNGDDSSTSSLPAEDAQSVVQTKIKVRRRSKHNIIETYLQDPTTPDNDTALAKLPPDPGDGTDERMRVRYTVERTTSKPVVTFASPAPDTSDVPPLAVYHICRICLRPRSTRYHCEHPIPINGVPPPPGICRRCRVSTIEEVAKTAMIVQEGESNKMKLGLAAFIPEEDYVSNKEMKERRARKLLRSVRRQLAEDKSASDSTDPGREIVYRHVRVRETTSDPPPQVKTSVQSTAQDAIDAVSVRSQVGKTTIVVAGTSKAVGPSSEKTQSGDVPASRAWASDAGFRQVGEGVISTAPARNSETTHPKTKITAYAGSVCTQPASAHAPSTAIARASATIVQPVRAERSESEIRKIAREEIARYRQAERKMEAHSDPYGHGRMVPVERRIEKQADVVEPMPWARKSEAVEEIVLTRRQKVPKESSSQPVRTSHRHKTMEASEPQPTRAASQRGEASSKAPTEVKASSAARPKRSGLSAELDRYVEREYVVERISDADGKVNTSSWKPYPAKIFEKKFESEWQAQPRDKVASESARSERRDWDVVAEKFSLVASSSQPRKSAQNRPRSVRSETPKWDARTEAGKATTDPGCDWGADAKHREVPGWEDEGEGYIKREIWLPPTGDYEVIEVIEENEKPRRVRTADHGTSYFQRRPPTPDEEAMPNRILEIESDVISGASKVRQPPKPDQWPRQASAKPSNHEAESNGGVASAWSSIYETVSDIRYRKKEAHSQPVHGPPSLSERSTRIAQTSRTSDHREYGEAAEKPSKGGDAIPDRIGHAEKPTEPTRPRAFDLRWAAAVNAAAAGAEATTEEPRPGKPGRANEADLNDSDGGSDKTRWPGHSSSKPGSRTGRSDAGTKRRTKPSEAPVSERGSHRTCSERSPEREYIFTERIVEPAGRQWERERSGDALSRRYVETTEYFSASRGSKAGSGFSSTAGPNSDREDRSQASTRPRAKPASQSTTTQPTSNTSRNQRTIYREVKAGEGSEHSSGRVRFASKVDVSPTPPDSEASSTQFRMIGARPCTKEKTAAQVECGKDLIAEYEERRGRSRARDRARPAAVEEEGAEYFYERKEVERSRSRCDGAEDGSDRKEGAQSRSREPKPIGWAFSESPSRELHGEVHAGEKEDGFGPYRPEMPRPDSTDLNSLAVGSGSGHGEDASAKHSVHGRWQEDLPVLEGVGW